MIELSDREAGELRERLRRVASAQPAEETIAVSTNASTSVTFTHTQTVAVIDVLAQWTNEPGAESRRPKTPLPRTTDDRGKLLFVKTCRFNS